MNTNTLERDTEGIQRNESWHGIVYNYIDVNGQFYLQKYHVKR